MLDRSNAIGEQGVLPVGCKDVVTMTNSLFGSQSQHSSRHRGRVRTRRQDLLKETRSRTLKGAGISKSRPPRGLEGLMSEVESWIPRAAPFFVHVITQQHVISGDEQWRTDGPDRGRQRGEEREREREKESDSVLRRERGGGQCRGLLPSFLFPCRHACMSSCPLLSVSPLSHSLLPSLPFPSLPLLNSLHAKTHSRSRLS